MSNNAARNNGSTGSATRMVQRAFAYQGIFARVARNLGLGSGGRSHVYRVARGQRQSRRVLNALIAEIERIERRAA